MNVFGKISKVSLIPLLSGAAALAADVRSRTAAGIIEADGRTVVTQVDAVLLVELEEAPVRRGDDVVVTWRREGAFNQRRFALPFLPVASRKRGLVPGLRTRAAAFAKQLERLEPKQTRLAASGEKRNL